LARNQITTASTDSLPLSLNDYIYTDVVAAPCVRLLNATGVIGCQGMLVLSHAPY